MVYLELTIPFAVNKM